MPTIKQSNLADEIVKNSSVPIEKQKNAQQLLESAGYKTKTARASAKRTIKQKGVQERLEVLGFDADSAKQVVADIMNNKRVNPIARLKATDQIFKVVGSYAPEKRATVTYTISSKDKEKIDRILGIKN